MSEHDWTEKQGQYLAFIYNYTVIHGEPPSERDMQHFFRVTPPTVHQMVLRLEEKGLISRVPRQARTIRVLVEPEDLPVLRGRKRKKAKETVKKTVKKTVSKEPIYQVKVTLNGIRPPVWRRLLVPGDVTLEGLHDIIQIAMGWTDSHLHRFFVGQMRYGEPHPNYGLEMQDEQLVTLGQVAPREGFRFRYEYDFGGWMHTVLVEKIVEPESGQQVPACIKGKRACPPENIGSARMYAYFLEMSRNPEHPEYPGNAEFLECFGDQFDPEAFDLEETNAILQKLRVRRGAF